MKRLIDKLPKDMLQMFEEPKISRLCGKATYTSLFLLPAVGLNLNDRLFARFFENAFIDDFGMKHDYKYPVFCLFRVERFDTSWRILEGTMKGKENYLFDYTLGMYEDAHLVMFVFECAAKFRSDYTKYLNGDYSQFSEFYKKFFTKTLYANKTLTIENPAWSVITKSDAFRKKLEELVGQKIDKQAEYWPKYESEREVYRFNKQIEENASNEV